MDNLFQHSLGEKSEHPAREMLLLFVDGELAAKEATQLETHLEACWACRVKTQKIQETIAAIIEFDEQVLTPRIVPPQGWRNFDRKLSQLVAASGKQSLSTRLFGSLNRFLRSSHLFSLPRPLFTPLVVRSVVAVLMVALIVALVIRFNREPTVSASELLQNAVDAQSKQIQAVDQPVIHQQLLVRRKAENSESEEVVDWEIWSDAKNARVRQFIANGNQSIPLTSTTSAKNQQKRSTQEEFILDLARVLEANHMNPQRPLSAASYQAWHNTLQRQQDQVTKSKLADGVDALTLRTVPAARITVGQISEAVFVVRARDWQPTELRLTVAAEVGNRVYELSQTAFEVVALAQVNPAIFADQPIVLAAKPKTSPSPPSSPAQLNPAALPVTVEPPRAVATADLEVEALHLLSDVGADLGDQINVDRRIDGLLHIAGIVDTEQRKAEIIRALQPLANNPACRIEIYTVAEAVAQQHQQRLRSQATPAPIRQESIQINSDNVAAAPELRRHFNSEEETRNFATRMLRQSRNAMSHVYALKRLIAQFTPESLRTLTPEARTKWLDLVRAHARGYQSDVENLQHELQPIFGSAFSTGAGVSAITDDASLARAVEELFAAASSTDATIHSAFAASTGSVATSAISSPQFWQQMKRAETISARIAQTK